MPWNVVITARTFDVVGRSAIGLLNRAKANLFHPWQGRRPQFMVNPEVCNLPVILAFIMPEAGRYLSLLGDIRISVSVLVVNLHPEEALLAGG